MYIIVGTIQNLEYHLLAYFVENTCKIHLIEEKRVIRHNIQSYNNIICYGTGVYLLRKYM